MIVAAALRDDLIKCIYEVCPRHVATLNAALYGFSNKLQLRVVTGVIRAMMTERFKISPRNRTEIFQGTQIRGPQTGVVTC